MAERVELTGAGSRHWATVWEAVADAVPDRPAIVQGELRRSWADFESRAALLAGAFEAAGLGSGAKVAQFLYNSPHYAESTFAALKVRAVPVNVNYRYTAAEVRYILDNADAEVLLFHTSLADRVVPAVADLPGLRLLIAVDDGPAEALPDGAVAYEDLLASAAPAPRRDRDPRDRSMTYTGGTTGMPKGVMGRIGGGVTGLMATLPTLLGRAPVEDAAGAARLAADLAADGASIVTLAACPLMHGTGLVIGMQTALLFGGTMCLLAQRHFDAAELWDLAERERVNLVAVVGDPFARPMLRELDEAAADGRGRDLDAMRFVSSSGAMFSTEVKQGLLRHLPQLTILDYISSTEGLMGVSIATRDAVPPTGRFRPAAGVKVFDDGDREVVPGSGAAGLVALSAGVPDGYYKDAEKSARTFREVGGVRYSFPGDAATVNDDGTITLLGRGSQCINTGGEKVFPEEVEEALKRQDGVEDCLVFGVPDERFGQRVVAVAAAPGTGADEAELLRAAEHDLASYKLPRRILFVDRVPRSPSGKADYPAARRLFEAATATAGPA